MVVAAAARGGLVELGLAGSGMGDAEARALASVLRGGGGATLPLPVLRYRRLRIQGDQARGGVGYRFTA
jgi:hypothetical protein